MISVENSTSEIYKNIKVNISDVENPTSEISKNVKVNISDWIVISNWLVILIYKVITYEFFTYRCGILINQFYSA